MNVLLGVSKPSKVQEVKDVEFFDDKLNTSQQEAIRFALGSPEVGCIHGPPGKFGASMGLNFDILQYSRDGQDAYTHRNHPSNYSETGRHSIGETSARLRRVELVR